MNILDRISKARWAFCEKYYAPPTRLYLHPELKYALYAELEDKSMLHYRFDKDHYAFMDMVLVEVYPLDYLEVG